MENSLKGERADLFIIGLTGNIACGKSAVLRMLAERGAHVVDADSLIHRIQAPGGTAYQPIIDAFGTGIVAADGTLDRRKLGAIVFADPTQLRRLEAITHPLVRVEIVAEVHAAPPGVAVVDAIRLFESGLAAMSDQVWVVTCPPDVQLRRLMARNGFSEEEARMRIAAQPPQEEKVARADVVIANGGTRQETEAQAAAAWQRLENAR